MLEIRGIPMRDLGSGTGIRDSRRFACKNQNAYYRRSLGALISAQSWAEMADRLRLFTCDACTTCFVPHRRGLAAMRGSQ